MKPKSIILDTGFLIALLNERDAYHLKALSLRDTIEHKKWFTTWLVLTEACYVLQSRGKSQSIPLLLKLSENGSLNLYHFTLQMIPRMIALLQKYAI